MLVDYQGEENSFSILRDVSGALGKQVDDLQKLPCVGNLSALMGFSLFSMSPPARILPLGSPTLYVRVYIPHKALSTISCRYLCKSVPSFLAISLALTLWQLSMLRTQMCGIVPCAQYCVLVENK